MKLIFIFSLIPVFFLAVNGEELLPPDPFSVDDIKLDLSKNRPISGDVKKDEKTKHDVHVKPNTPIIFGSADKTVFDKAEPTVDSVKTKSSDDSDKSEDKTEVKGIGKKSKKTTFVDVPDTILKSVEEKTTPNLRTEKSKKDDNKDNKTKLEDLDKDKNNPETKGDTGSDSSKEGDKKDDPLFKSLEGAEKQLSETFGAVKTKLSEPGKVNKPIKVDCGTTRVRVVCSKKNEEAKTEAVDKDDKKDEDKEDKDNKEPEKTDKPEEKEPEKEEEKSETSDSDESKEGGEENES